MERESTTARAMRIALTLVLFAFAGTGCAEAERLARTAMDGGTTTTADGTVERGVDRPGQNYCSVDLAGAGYAACQRACAAEGQWRAWTFTEPAVQSDGGMCWLKDGVPAVRQDARMVSGVVTR